MRMQFYKNHSDNIVVDKKITAVGSEINGILREDCSLTDPVITIEDFASFNPATANYCYLPSFNRYYYITNVVFITDKLFEIHMHVDVLKSFASGIRSNNAVIGRQEKKGVYNLLLQDGTYKVKANPNLEIRQFPSGFSGHHYILMVAGV